jgi:hypothetical protein
MPSRHNPPAPYATQALNCYMRGAGLPIRVWETRPGPAPEAPRAAAAERPAARAARFGRHRVSNCAHCVD